MRKKRPMSKPRRDAPVAIVDAALRASAQKAIPIDCFTISVVERDGVLRGMGNIDLPRIVDAVLSTVLGHVRYMKDGPVVMSFVSGNVEVVASLEPTEAEREAILEEEAHGKAE